MKLSEVQRRTLARMAEGHEVWTISGRSASSFWHKAMTERAPSFATLHVLWKNGLVRSERDATGSIYRITDAGRAALDAEKRG